MCTLARAIASSQYEKCPNIVLAQMAISVFTDVLNTTLRNLYDILNVNTDMVSQICPSELQLNKVNTSDKEAAF